MSVAIGDKTFHAVEIPTTVGLAVRCFEHDRLKVRARIGFGQIHRHRLTGAYTGKETLFLVFTGKLVNRFGTILQPPNIHKACIGTAHHIGRHDIGHKRKIESAITTRKRDTHKTGFYQSIEVTGRTRSIFDMAIDYARAFVIDALGIGCHDFAANFTGDFKHFFITIHSILEVDRCIVIFPGIGIFTFFQSHNPLHERVCQVMFQITVIGKKIGHNPRLFAVFLIILYHFGQHVFDCTGNHIIGYRIDRRTGIAVD